MILFAASTLILTSLSSPVSDASAEDWTSLDREIASLSSALSAQGAAPKLGGFLAISWRQSNDLQFSGNDESGFRLENIRVEITGDAGSDYTYSVSFDLAGGVAALKDAWVEWKMGDVVKGRMGNMKQPFLRSGLLHDAKLLFLERTGLGDIFKKRDVGLMFSGTFDTVGWWVAAQNGVDTKGDEYLYTGRLQANLLGGGVGKTEGAYGAGDETRCTVALSVADEGSLDDGQHVSLEAEASRGPLGFAAEVVDFDKGTAGSFGKMLKYGAKPIGDVADTTPWDATLSYVFAEVYEAAIRYQDADDVNDTTSWGVVVNRYVHGHDIKWQAQYTSCSSDIAANEIDELGVGLVVSF